MQSVVVCVTPEGPGDGQSRQVPAHLDVLLLLKQLKTRTTEDIYQVRIFVAGSVRQQRKGAMRGSGCARGNAVLLQ